MSDLLYRTGIAPINWSNEDKPELGASISLDQCLREIQEAGYSGTEPGYKFPETPDTMNQILKKYNLRLASSWFSTFFADHQSHSQQLHLLEQKLKFLKACGARCINLAECTRAIHGDQTRLLSDKPELTNAEWDRFLEGMDKASVLCEKYDILLTYHQHMGTVIQNEDELTRLLANTNPKTIGLCLDTGHLMYAGMDSYEIYCLYQHRVWHVHLKDLRNDVFKSVGQNTSFLDAVLKGIFTVPGDGLIDFVPLVSRLQKDRYKGWIIVEAEQDPERANPLDYAKTGMNYLKSLYIQTSEKAQEYQ